MTCALCELRVARAALARAADETDEPIVAKALDAVDACLAARQDADADPRFIGEKVFEHARVCRRRAHAEATSR